MKKLKDKYGSDDDMSRDEDESKIIKKIVYYSY